MERCVAKGQRTEWIFCATYHDDSVYHGPEGAPYTERRSSDDGKANVISSTDAASGSDEAARNEIADPNADP